MAAYGVTGWHNTAGPFTVLRVVRKLNGVERPDIRAKTTHRKFGSTVAGMAKNNVGLHGEDILHFTYHNPKK